MRGIASAGAADADKPEIVLDTRRARLVADRGNQALAPRRIKTVGGRIFVEQLLEPQRDFRQCGRASGGGRWPIVTAPMRRLACAASPGSLTMKG